MTEPKPDQDGASPDQPSAADRLAEGGVASLKGETINLVELSVSHYLLARAL